VFTFDDYVRFGALDAPGNARPAKVKVYPKLRGHRAAIEYAIANGLNGLIVGRPQAGKSTLLNAVQFATRQRAPNRRVFLIEDSVELKDDALPENTLRVQPSAKLGITDSDLLQVGKRVRPDGIIVAELLRPQACYNFLAPVKNGLQFVSSLAKRIPVASAIARFARPGVGVRDRNAPGHKERLQFRLAIIGLS
jgi:type IV secretory pathway ATPase VirB11/archaellum biosynthesis ATPase